MKRFMLGPKRRTLIAALVAAEEIASEHHVISFQVVAGVEHAVDTSPTPFPASSYTSYQVALLVIIYEKQEAKRGWAVDSEGT